MACSCVSTAILMENENEKLRTCIKELERKVKKYQRELLVLYSSGSDSSSPSNSEGSINDISFSSKYKTLYTPAQKHTIPYY